MTGFFLIYISLDKSKIYTYLLLESTYVYQILSYAIQPHLTSSTHRVLL